MARRYTAYLLRHWVFGDGRERVEVQRLPSGEAHRCGSLADAYAWLHRQHTGPGDPGSPSQEATPASPSGEADAGARESRAPPRPHAPGRVPCSHHTAGWHRDAPDAGRIIE